MSEDQETFAQAKLAWEELADVWDRGDQRTPEGRRALQGLKDALEALHDFMDEAAT